MEWLSSDTLLHVPVASASRFAHTWSECIKGCLAGASGWGAVARFRCRILLAPLQEGIDKGAEIKRRLGRWEAGDIVQLGREILGAQQELRHRREGGGDERRDSADEARGKRARGQAAVGQISKAMKGLAEGMAQGGNTFKYYLFSPLLQKLSALKKYYCIIFVSRNAIF